MFRNYILNEITKEKNHIINQLDHNYCKANAIRKRRKKSLKIYHQTEEYQASLEEALAKSKRYQKLISEHATEDEDQKKEYDAFEQRQKEQKEREKKRQEEKRLQQLRVQEKLTEMEQCLKKLDFTPLLKKYMQKRIREIEQSYSLDVISVETYDDYFQSNYIYNKKLLFPGKLEMYNLLSDTNDRIHYRFALMFHTCQNYECHRLHLHCKAKKKFLLLLQLHNNYLYSELPQQKFETKK